MLHDLCVCLCAAVVDAFAVNAFVRFFFFFFFFLGGGGIAPCIIRTFSQTDSSNCTFLLFIAQSDIDEKSRRKKKEGNAVSTGLVESTSRQKGMGFIYTPGWR